MATDNKPKSSKKGKTRYLPHNRAAKKKGGAYPLHPGVEGFFITCDGGRERQASQEALNVIDSFFEELVQGKGAVSVGPSKPINKKIKFSYSDSNSSGSDNDDDSDNKKEEGETAEPVEGNEATNEEIKSDTCKRDCDVTGEIEAEEDTAIEGGSISIELSAKQVEEAPAKGDSISIEILLKEDGEPLAKKQCIGTDESKRAPHKVEEKSIDRLIEDELKELKDKNKRRFIHLEPGCNGVVFVQMRKKDGDPGPKDIVQHMMTSAAATKKHMSRFILRILPIEVSCYSSEEEISKAIKPVIEKYFPLETDNPLKFAVLYGARANTGIDRMQIIDAVAKCVPQPHKVDLSNPDLNIVVEICRTICLIGVVENYKQLAKYNLRQLTAPKQ